MPPRTPPLEARRLVGFGVLTAAPSAWCGRADWSDTTGSEQRTGALHAACNTAALALYGLSWMARRRPGRRGPMLSLAGAIALAAGGYRGGHLSHAMGVGVDTNAFHTGPADWTTIDIDSHDISEGDMKVAVAHATTLVIAREGGRISALGNRCSYRGAPLAEGTVKDGCVVCPWHESAFDLRTGEVIRGSAT
jgi:nitrite reductase/ring-hydroxylating ferredoxin subunit